MVYFIADTHFGHQATISFGRPFESVDIMDRTVIDNWNAVVKDEDTVYILGDFVYKSNKPVSYYASQLPGTKILLPGNHDSWWMEKQPEALRFFAEVSPYIEVTKGGPAFNICHYAMLDWNGWRRGRFMIHGHTHGTDYLHKHDKLYTVLADMPNALNACVDINGYAPVTLEQLIRNNNKFYRRK